MNIKVPKVPELVSKNIKPILAGIVVISVIAVVIIGFALQPKTIKVVSSKTCHGTELFEVACLYNDTSNPQYHWYAIKEPNCEYYSLLTKNFTEFKEVSGYNKSEKDLPLHCWGK